jgi:hypothetical protein
MSPSKKGFFLHRRKNFLIDLTSKLDKENFSIMASSGGNHRFDHHIDHFNKGIYHIALESGLDICPLFIDTPRECNPFSVFLF